MIDGDAVECWHCGASISRAVGADTASGAPTLAASEVDGGTREFRGPSMIGRDVIGQYVIRRKLGEGGMGEVYLADQPAIGRQVAIKIVHAQTRGRDLDDHVARFRNEAKAAASLESPHIVQIFNWGELDDGTLFMAMEFLSGPTLGELVREHGALDPERVVAIATQVCAALTQAHAAGIVHRDLKPSNIMLIERGDAPGPSFAKVLDFGIAKLEGSDITRSGAMFGTPQYMSPEQLRAEALDGRSDLYSLGVMLYELLAGALPFSSPTAVGYVTAHLHDQPPPLPRHVPRALAEVVTMLLAKHADDRPATAAAVADALAAALKGRSPIAVRRRARQRALRTTLLVTLAVVSGSALSFGGWWLWTTRAKTNAALERERARGRALEQRVREQDLAVQRAREEARTIAQEQLLSSTKAREERREVQAANSSRPTGGLDDETRALLTRTRGQLEVTLRRVLDGRRIPPSEVEDVWRTHEARVAALEAGELEEVELREQLVSMIQLYRRSFEPKRPGDELPLAQLDATFMSMPTKLGHALGEAERRELLTAIYETYDAQDLSVNDRTYFKRLAVAKLIREHEVAPGEQASELVPSDAIPTKPTGPKRPDQPPPDELPTADDDDDEPAGNQAPLPSLDGM
ncbi:Serine/threonine-protein kinase PrkC [Enhygromyxa salina]|uniref:non-specific serine/threonine protein kinase n=2 Tax=Enhygromyxa salina TaxID=215803 RepID=A0A2S9YWW2_9BACT|nr:Serine/threonine-protein kinase PrkC [Enhygromyxa salina]